MKTDEVLERFSEMMISRMQQIKASDWKRGWFTQSYNGNPVNLGGREYNGMNSFILFFWMMKEGRFKYPIFATFRQIKALGANINKGEKSCPVLFWSIQYKDKDGNKITEDCYNGMSRQEQLDCYARPFLKSYNVFNLSQTNLEEVAPKAMEKLKSKFGFKDKQDLPTDTIGMYQNERIDDMLINQRWVCPIRFDQYSSSAYYRTVTDDITIPQKSQFRKSLTEQGVFEDGQEYYSTLIHEMIHSTGHKSRLDRNSEKYKGENGYAREELVAELGAALASNVLGFSSRILENSAAYLDFWVSKLKQQPKYIVSVLSDANRAAKMVLEAVNSDKCQLSKTA